MATQQINGNAVTLTSTRNNGGALKGSLTSSIKSNLVDGVEPGGHPGVTLGNLILNGSYIDPALAAGTFAYFAKGKYVIRRVSDTLAGAANTTMRSGGANKGKDSIHKIEAKYTRRVSLCMISGFYNFVSGSFSTAPNNVKDSFGADAEARSSYTSAAEFTYLGPAPDPVSDDYDLPG